MIAIETTDLTKRFGDLTAVNQLSLTVSEGSIFGFLGRNGAGKSTTINVLLGFMRPTSGSATILGHDIETESRKIREKIGVLPEGFTPYDRLTAREHVEYSADLKDVEADADELLRRVGLDESAWDRTAGGFSTGMKMRLALACALVGDPELLILDEPSAGLDPQGMGQIRELLRSEAARGTTVFYSSHILSQVESVCDRVGIMNSGELIATDTVEGLRDEADLRTRFEISVDSVPDGLQLERVDGVVSTTIRERTIQAACTEGRAKARLINEVEKNGAVVTDIKSGEASLEDLFNAYLDTGDGSVQDGGETSAQVVRS